MWRAPDASGETVSNVRPGDSGRALPGLYPEDITVEVTVENRLVLQGQARGRLKADVSDVWATRHDDAHGTSSGPSGKGSSTEQLEVLLDEWEEAVPYYRELDLPAAVDRNMATVTYGNGVLVVSLTVAPRTTPARLTLEAVGQPLGGPAPDSDRLGATFRQS